MEFFGLLWLDAENRSSSDRLETCRLRCLSAKTLKLHDMRGRTAESRFFLLLLPQLTQGTSNSLQGEHEAVFFVTQGNWVKHYAMGNQSMYMC